MLGCSESSHNPVTQGVTHCRVSSNPRDESVRYHCTIQLLIQIINLADLKGSAELTRAREFATGGSPTVAGCTAGRRCLRFAARVAVSGGPARDACASGSGDLQAAGECAKAGGRGVLNSNDVYCVLEIK